MIVRTGELPFIVPLHGLDAQPVQSRFWKGSHVNLRHGPEVFRLYRLVLEFKTHSAETHSVARPAEDEAAAISSRSIGLAGKRQP